MAFLFDWATFGSANGSTTITDGANSTTFTSTASSSAGANNPSYTSSFGGSIGAQGVASGQQSTLTLSFSTSVDNLSFEILDLDARSGSNGSGWDDQVQIYAYDADGNLLTPTFTNLSTTHDVLNPYTVDANGNNSTGVEGSGAADSFTVSYDVPVATITIVVTGGNSGRSTGYVGISDFTGDVVCFAADTLIDTDKGQVAVQDLGVGDMVRTLDNGYQPIRWVGSRRIAAEGKFAPIVIKKNALGNTRTLVLSPQHRVLLQGWQAELLFGEDEILVAAKHLVDDKNILRREGGEITYYHIMFDRHEIVLADDTPCESFHPGHVGVDGLPSAQRDEIFALFPELEKNLSAFGPLARMAAKSSEGEMLAAMARQARH